MIVCLPETGDELFHGIRNVPGVVGELLPGGRVARHHDEALGGADHGA